MKKLTGNTHQAGSVHGHDDRLLLLSSEQLQGEKNIFHLYVFLNKLGPEERFDVINVQL